MLAPEDISAGVLWLASEETRNITGYVMLIDAGFLGSGQKGSAVIK